MLGMSGWVVVAVGVILCFAGVASLNLAVLVSAFAVVWLLADVFGASTGTALLVAAAGAVAVWVLVRVVFRTALFFVGALAVLGWLSQRRISARRLGNDTSGRST